ncbi:hypothetical protein [Sapientia aquatica]|uniref:Uncharacterized protein n=1 Tax=Sapientia aquatica TaxID=1549640 RepID=A0A4R5VMZ8_9BURK|nr:hypothetical protein [Sapientia aquatica]TDK59581.1 hypothetical protein E2I14_18705 [Sapientia aquatica]
MLPLWLNLLKPSIQLAVADKGYGKQSWFGRTTANWSVKTDVSLNSQDRLTAAVEQLLDDRPIQKKALSRPARLTIIVPDEVARFELLPWIPSLMQDDELRQFAIERFELHNQSVRDGWVVQAEWRTNEANTLGYALPQELLETLQNIAAKNGVQLTRVLPVSALAHYGQLGISRTSQLRLLNSGARISALLYRHGKLHSHAIEAVRGNNNEDALRRLLSRVQTNVALTELNLQQIAVMGIDPDIVRRILVDSPNIRIHKLRPLRFRDWL